jgi:hypothetical protein
MAHIIVFTRTLQIRERFNRAYGQQAMTAMAYAMNKEFSKILGEQMKHFTSSPSADKVRKVQSEIDDVKQVIAAAAAAAAAAFFSLLCVAASFLRPGVFHLLLLVFFQTQFLFLSVPFRSLPFCSHAAAGHGAERRAAAGARRENRAACAPSFENRI